MKLDALTLIIVLGLILGTQLVAFFVQYRINRTYKGIGYWLVGSSVMALGFIAMSFIAIKSLENISRISNPLIVLGLILLYIGVVKFLCKNLNKWIPIWIFIIIRIFLTIRYNPGQSYLASGSTIISTVLVSIVASNLWTLGLINMIS